MHGAIWALFRKNQNSVLLIDRSSTPFIQEDVISHCFLRLFSKPAFAKDSCRIHFRGIFCGVFRVLAGMKRTLDRTKVVLRHLPPSITEALLIEQVDSAFAGRYNWFSFRPGKNRLVSLLFLNYIFNYTFFWVFYYPCFSCFYFCYDYLFLVWLSPLYSRVCLHGFFLFCIYCIFTVLAVTVVIFK